MYSGGSLFLPLLSPSPYPSPYFCAAYSSAHAGNPPNPARLLRLRAAPWFRRSACPRCSCHTAAGFRPTWRAIRARVGIAQRVWCGCDELHRGNACWKSTPLTWSTNHCKVNSVFLSGHRQPSLLKTLMGCLIRWWKLFTVGDPKFCHFNNG